MDAKTLQWIVNKALAKQQKQFTEQIKEMNTFQQKLEIEQGKASFKTLADKRAIVYLVDEEFDFNDAMKSITVDNKLLPIQGKKAQFWEFGKFCLHFASMRSRKEVEA